LALAQGRINTAPITEPTPILVKTNPRFEASKCNSFRPTTGIKAGMAEMKKANRRLRARTIWMPGA
jgi:hypothetical protein